MIFVELIFIGIKTLTPSPQRNNLKMSDFKDDHFKMQAKVACIIENKFVHAKYFHYQI